MSKGNKTNVSVNCGGSLLTLLTVIFVIAKLLNIIDWSWWWVFAPVWIPAGIGFLAFVGAVFIVALNNA